MYIVRALIMGGGLAGLGAAVHLIANGFDVTSFPRSRT
jgi:uncharacterized protein with NAD-binding domain and iron-sulfur cluster